VKQIAPSRSLNEPVPRTIPFLSVVKLSSVRRVGSSVLRPPRGVWPYFVVPAPTRRTARHGLRGAWPWWPVRSPLLALHGCGLLCAAKIVGETAGVGRRPRGAYARYGTSVPVWSGDPSRLRRNQDGTASWRATLPGIGVTQGADSAHPGCRRWSAFAWCPPIAL
jgi:hypothetical protein